MEIKNRLGVCIWLPALFLFACPIDRDPPGPPPEKAYHAEILWEREVNRDIASGIPLVDEQYCYLPAYEYYPSGGPNIVKINMETGRVAWETRRIRDSSSEKPQKIGAHIYLPGISGLIFVYNDSDGKLAATVRLGNDETEAKNNRISSLTPVAVSDPYLFWGRNGLMRFNSEQIDFSKVPDTIQDIVPEQIWSNSWQAQIESNFISENGILYFITRSYTDTPENPSVLVALDAKTGDVIWEREAPHCRGSSSFSLTLNDDKLLVVEETFSSYDKFTGVSVLENTPLGHSRHGRITQYNNRLFYLGNGNLVSVNADTGKLIWRVSPTVFGELDEFETSPLVNNGQVFIIHHTGLRVYNADTGEFIGVDGSFPGNYLWQWSDEIAIYKDTYICISNDYVIAIQCK